MKKFIVSNPWSVGIGTTVCAGIILFILLPSKSAIQVTGDVQNSIQTVNQTGGTNVISDNPDLKEKMAYSYVASLDVLGLPYHVTFPIIIETPISKILTPFVHIDTNKTSSDCSELAMSAFQQVISLDQKFPFSHYFLGTCKKLLGNKDWKNEMNTAYKILLITTQIAGHNINHGQALEDIRNRFADAIY